MATVEEHSEPAPQVHSCVVRGITADGSTPYQRIYATYDEDTARSFNALLGMIEHDSNYTQEDIDEVVNEQFPELILLMEQLGNDITEEIPESLPLGEGYWDEHDQYQLLCRALMQLENEAKLSLRKTGNELLSNLPTFWTIVDKGDIGYMLAGAAGAGIAGAITWRGKRQNDRFERVLDIFVEFLNNRNVNPDMAKEVLEKRMRFSGLLFSGIRKFDLRQFDESKYIQIAIKKDRWYEKNTLARRIAQLSHPPKVTGLKEASIDAYRRFRAASAVAGDFMLEQGLDLVHNPTSPKTYKNIFYGAINAGLLVVSFSRKARNSEQYRKMVSDHPELDGKVTIDQHEVVRAASGTNIIKEIEASKADLEEQKTDGKIMLGAFTAEGLFMGAHAYEAGEAAMHLSEKAMSGELFNNDAEGGFFTTGAGDDISNILVSVYSMAMASGAFSYLADEISEIRGTIDSERGRLINDLYVRAMDRYVEQKNGDAPSAEA